MPLSIESSSSGTSTANTSYSYSHTVIAAVLIVLAAGAGDPTAGDRALSSATFGGSTMSSFPINTARDDGNFLCISIRYYPNPTPGANNVVVNHGGSCEAMGSGVTGFIGANTSTFGTVAVNSSTSTNTPAVTVTSASGELVFAAVSSDANATITETGTLAWEQQAINGDTCFGAQTYSGSGSVNAQWSASTPDNGWAAIGVSIKPDTGGAVAIIGRTIQGQFNDLTEFFSSSKLTKPQAGGAAPQGATKLGRVFQSQFNDILGYDFVSSSKQTKGLTGGAAPPGATILGKSFVSNPAPNSEAEWDYANGVSIASASPGVDTTPNVPNLIPKVNANPLFIDYEDFTLYQFKVIRGQPGVPPVIGLPRHSYINVAATATQIIDDDSMFISRFGVKNSHPSNGIIPAPPVTNVISGAGLVGAGTMRGN